MSAIVNKGGFDFMCKTQTGKTISCFLDNDEPVEANFDKLELSYNGTIKVLTQRGGKNVYVSVSRLKPRNEKDQGDFDAARHETEIVSQKRKHELKVQKKSQARLKEPQKRSA